MLFALLAHAALSLPAEAATAAKAIVCLQAMAHVQGNLYGDTWVKGSVPLLVNYDKPHGPLAVWKRKDGTLLVVSGDAIYRAPVTAGKTNGFTFMRDPEAVAERSLFPSTFRVVELPDGRIFDLHRFSGTQASLDFVRSQAEDAQTLAEEKEHVARKLRSHEELLRKNIEEVENLCEPQGRPQVDRTLTHRIDALLKKIPAMKPPGMSPREEERVSTFGLDYAQEKLAELRARGQELAGWEQSLAGMKKERVKPGNRLKVVPLGGADADRAELLKEAVASFQNRVDLANLSEEERTELAACNGVLELPAVAPPAEPQESAYERAVRNAVPPEYRAIYDAIRAAQKASQKKSKK